jgi:cyclin T
MPQQHGQQSQSSSLKPPGQPQSHDPTQKRSQGMYIDNYHKNRPNHSSGQSGVAQKHPVDQRHSSSSKGIPDASKASNKPNMYPNSANQDQYRNKTMYPQQQQSSSNSGNARNPSASVPSNKQKMETSSKPSFSLVDETSYMLDPMTKKETSTPPKRPPSSIFDPDCNDGDMQMKMKNNNLLKPNKESPVKRERSNTPVKKEKPTGPQQHKIKQENNKKMPENRLFDMKPVKTISPIKDEAGNESHRNFLREQQHMQRQNSRQSQGLFELPGQKRPFSSVDQSSGGLSMESKKQKISNQDFFDNAFEAAFEGVQFGQQGGGDFSMYHNDNTNSQSNSSFQEKAVEQKIIPATTKESNPDFVKSLLQASFTSQDNKFSALTTVDTNDLLDSITQIPHELPDDVMAPFPEPIEPLRPLVTEKTLNLDTNSMSTMLSDNSQGSGENHKKSKKKKDKHKHKDRSKDKEERKKHKKDKDREKDRHKHRERAENEVGGGEGPLKVKLSLPAIEENSLKLKIPKEAIKPDLTDNGKAADTSIKIKISKDKIKNYNDVPGGVGDGLGSSSSHKKKEKERSRDKEKERSKSSKSAILEPGKLNGTGAEFTRNQIPITQNQQQQQQQQQMMYRQMPDNSTNFDYATLMNSGATKVSLKLSQFNIQWPIPGHNRCENNNFLPQDASIVSIHPDPSSTSILI